ncbi:uncharacterized protein LOC119385530 [Rhipicephalus sanguineus]|uniref:uncharacterized protein LOC119385530 n=1 Tax=Rhipicephalus sanguineus TaxID=34632 RepID=UPI0020C3A77E|nr:uncharacterized protein LOC119385530 [Rhipicephalus sanguineus]
MSVTDEQSGSTVDVGDIFGNDFVVENVFDCLGTEDLFTCAEVNRLWQSVALSRLKKRLISVSICCTPDSEQPIEEPAPGRLHACVEILCSKFARYRNIARLAGMRPSLVFLSYHADLNEDRHVVDCVRQLLPGDSVIVYFKLELIRTADDSDDNSHEGVFGEFLFHAEPVVRPAARDDGRQQPPPPESLVTGPSSPGPSQVQGRPSEGEPTPPRPAPPGPVAATADAAAPVAAEQPAAADAPAAAEAPAIAEAPDAAVAPAAGLPPAGLPVTWPRPRIPSRGRGSGAVFHNVLPGVLMFQALHVTEGTLEADVANSCFKEEATGKVIKVTSVAIFNAMQSSRLDPFMRSLGESFGPTTNTIAVAFPRNQDEARLELEAFERCFPRVPALANQATEFNVDGQFAPIGRLKLILLLIKLLD